MMFAGSCNNSPFFSVIIIYVHLSVVPSALSHLVYFSSFFFIPQAKRNHQNKKAQSPRLQRP